MINITIILRVRKFFPGKLDSVIALLLPVQYRLTPAFVNRLYSAATGEQASALLRESPYKKIFIAHDYAHIEDYYYQFLYDFNRRLLALGLPSVYTPAAYLSLREIELKNLTTAIECVRYGLQPSEAPTYLFGVPL
jgi:V/A-type H+-transporting ATPase subunit C